MAFIIDKDKTAPESAILMNVSWKAVELQIGHGMALRQKIYSCPVYSLPVFNTRTCEMGSIFISVWSWKI